MASGYLKVKGDQIIDSDGNPIVMRGAAIGGWMNMENFITGYPGHEHEHRKAMLKVLGKEKYDFFFDKFLEYFFTDADAAFFASLGLNCLRIPFNYRHLEDDMNPRVLKEEGFKHLDRVIDLCSKHKIYTILDMHTAPGGHNPDWHSDNPTSYAAFWDYKDHQDRTVWLWEQIAARYKDNTWIAGYNPLNEPCDPEHLRLPIFYNRIEAAIRKVDPGHILWLDGNTFSMEWQGFDKVLPNCVYALHDYSTMGFPTGETFTGSEEQTARLEKAFLRKAEFMKENSCPIWNGEFGPVYAPSTDPSSSTINTARTSLLSAQLSIYTRHHISWSIWLYKDIGLQGMLHTSPISPWNSLLSPFLARKQQYALDAWAHHPSPSAAAAVEPLVDWIEEVCPAAKETYPGPWGVERHVRRNVVQTFLSNAFSEEFAELFRGKSEGELEELVGSFRFDECVQRGELNEVLRGWAPK